MVALLLDAARQPRASRLAMLCFTQLKDMKFGARRV
jgi:hypothetical protein